MYNHYSFSLSLSLYIYMYMYAHNDIYLINGREHMLEQKRKCLEPDSYSFYFQS